MELQTAIGYAWTIAHRRPPSGPRTMESGRVRPPAPPTIASGAIAALLLLALTGAVQAATAIDLESRDRGQVTAMRVEVDRGFAVARSPLDPRVDLLFDSQRQSLFVVDHSTRSYTVVDEASVRQTMERARLVLGVVQSQISILPDEQRRMIEGLLDGAGGGPRPVLVATGDSGEAAGIACRRFQVIGDDGVEADVCLGEPPPAAVDPADVATLEAMMRFTDRIAGSMGTLLGELAGRVPDIGDAAGHGLPLWVALRGEDTGYRVTAVAPANVDPVRLTVPQGYAPRPLLPL